MELLEREGPLRELEAALEDALAGAGRVALVSGEAGIGKTALIEAFTRAHRNTVRVLWGACDALFTPRPLGPLFDMAGQTGGPLLAALNSDANRNVIFSAMLAELQRRPTLLVFEDVHWADEATLDLLRFLGRRIARTSALLVLTYRDDELGPRHPLRLLLGDLTAPNYTRRIAVAPLSEAAARTLVGERRIDVAALHRQTGGNPFFISEVLEAGGGGIPSTVRDAVLGARQSAERFGAGGVAGRRHHRPARRAGAAHPTHRCGGGRKRGMLGAGHACRTRRDVGLPPRTGAADGARFDLAAAETLAAPHGA